MAAGIKAQGEDLALILSDRPASAAGVFTRNVVKAAPVLLDAGRLPQGTARAVIVNSGNANSCTGDAGLQDALQMGREVANRLALREEDVLVASTGIIGRRLPMEKILDGIERAAAGLSRDGGASAARAIMTTDTRPKEAGAELLLGKAAARVGGIAKGAGMVCPDLATMLAFIATDAAIAPQQLHACLVQSVEKSFNCLTVDGDCSTNDSVIVLANGAAGNALMDSEGRDVDAFQEALDFVTASLAEQIAQDGEGATKLIEITVQGTSSFEEARKVAKTVANSPLVKTAVFGCDPNWGRVLAAAGRAGVGFDLAAVDLTFGSVTVVRAGKPTRFSIAALREVLSKPKVNVLIRIGRGAGAATVWTCDFSYDYVRINAEYHT